jgi:N-acetylmuramate 1-kinase
VTVEETMPPTDADGLDERVLRDALISLLRLPAPPAEVVALAGDASTRRYFRVLLPPGAPVPSLVVMRYPDEVAPGEELPFVNVHRYLRRAGVPVPDIHLAVPEAKMLLLSDAGDVMLEDRVRASASEEEHLPLYERCVAILVRLQVDGTRALDGRAHPARLAFDVKKFAEEIDFFFAHAVRSFGGIPLTDREERRIEDLLLPFLEELAALPRVLAHRDYHSRNVMVIPEVSPRSPPGLMILDFQDARMGTIFYDLASLFRDSYVTLSEKAVEHLSYVYRDAAPAGLRRMGADRDAFAGRLDAAALQRNIKAIGTFGNQAFNRGKTFYLRFIPPTVAHLFRNFERNPGMRPLAKRLHPILAALAEKAAREAPP